MPAIGAPKKEKKISDFNLAEGEEFWKLVRASFPLSNKIAYLNNGTMGPSPYSVIEEQYKATLDVDTTGNYGGWEEAVPALAKFVGVDEDEICLTHNVTEGINIICWGLHLKKGDEVIITNHEHVGNALPWLNRAKVEGIVLKTVALANTAAQTLNNISALITKKTRVIANIFSASTLFFPCEMDARVLLLLAVRSATLRDDHLTKGEKQMAKMTKQIKKVQFE